MDKNRKKLEELSQQMDRLLKRQGFLYKEVKALEVEISRLKASMDGKPVADTPPVTPPPLVDAPPVPPPVDVPPVVAAEETPPPPPKPKISKPSNLERFVGENLISKIGIIITVIGVAIGAKYSIDNELISPLTRIILGYVAGAVLLGIGIRLKAKYENYSAVLVSGAMAIMYFITYAAHSFYDLFPQSAAFGMMVLFTAFTVLAAIHYNKQVIAHIGLVGAYTVPFLLSDGSGNVAVMFTYMAIINAGILAISFWKQWKPLYLVAFGITWMIYAFWQMEGYVPDKDFNVAVTFLPIFFALFYLIFLAYKLLKKEKFNVLDILLVLANSFVFYGLGYALLEEAGMEDYLGMFTLVNAIIHFAVSALIYTQKLGDRNLFYLVSGLVMVFISIAIPVQLDGSWVTLLWIGQAALLFWVGRAMKVTAYEGIAYALVFLGVGSLFHDWGLMFQNMPSYGEPPKFDRTPLFNINGLSSALFIAALGLMVFVDKSARFSPTEHRESTWGQVVTITLSCFLLAIIYLSGIVEILLSFIHSHNGSVVEVFDEEYDYNYNQKNKDIPLFMRVWLANFTLAYMAALSLLNIFVFKNRWLGLSNVILNTFGLAACLAACLFALSLLRESYLEQHLAEYFEKGNYYLIIRYISLAFFLLAIIATRLYARREFMGMKLVAYLDLLVAASVLWLTSSELLHWMGLMGQGDSYKLGLSIFWGVYALIMIMIGIWRDKKYLRIAAFILFAFTLIKLFAYDISHLGTLPKTVVFISLGALLLVISFLYNKYKHLISDENQ